jgi:AraC family transcriptional activator of pyochelin receptor
MTDLLIASDVCINFPVLNLFSMNIESDDRSKLEYVKNLIITDITRHYTIGELSSQSKLNEFKLKQGFKALYGKPLFRYLQDERISKAISLLQTTEMEIREIAIVCGYGWAGNLTAVFRKRYKTTPTQFRRGPDTNTAMA